MSGKGNKWHQFDTKPNKFESDVDIDTGFETPSETESFKLTELLIQIAFVGILAAIGLVLWQIFTYLRFGEWHSYTIITAMRYFNIEWASNPKDWIGFYKIFDKFPLSLAFLLTGIIPPGVWILWDSIRYPKI